MCCLHLPTKCNRILSFLFVYMQNEIVIFLIKSSSGYEEVGSYR